MILTGNKIKQEVLSGKIIIDTFLESHLTTNSYDLTLGDNLVAYDDDILDPQKNPRLIQL